MSGVVVIPDEDGCIAPPFLPLHHIRHSFIIGEVGMAVEMDGLQESVKGVLSVMV